MGVYTRENIFIFTFHLGRLKRFINVTYAFLLHKVFSVVSFINMVYNNVFYLTVSSTPAGKTFLFKFAEDSLYKIV